MPRQPWSLFCLLLIFIPLSLTAQVALNQTDSFQNGTLNGWTSGGVNPNPPLNISANGPGGASDKYMRVVSTGVSGAGGKLVVQNSVQWIGNYTSAGIVAISMHVKNEGSTALQLRVALLGVSGSGVSTTPISLPVGGGWTTIMFPVTAGALAGSNVSSTLTNVTEIRLLHATTASTKGESVVAQLGVDDVTAVGTTAGVATDISEIPGEFELFQNYPNPFNPTTQIQFSATGKALLELYNVMGQKVATLFDGTAEAGQYYKVRVDGAGLASGLYLYRLQSGAKTELRRMTLLK
jgi:hypothetical protein